MAVYGTIEGEMVVAYLDIVLTLFVWNNRVKSPNAQTREDVSLPRFEAGIIRIKVKSFTANTNSSIQIVVIKIV